MPRGGANYRRTRRFLLDGTFHRVGGKLPAANSSERDLLPGSHFVLRGLCGSLNLFGAELRRNSGTVAWGKEFESSSAAGQLLCAAWHFSVHPLARTNCA